MKSRYFFFALYLTLPIFSEQNQPEKQPHINLPPEVALLKRKHEQRALEQVLNVKNNDRCPCLNYYDQEFITCMEYAAKEEVRETFTQMSLPARLNYLKKMDLFEYHHFLTAFENEHQWQESLNTLSPEDRKRIPQTMREQLIMIRDTWLECSTGTTGYYSKRTKDPDAKDLSAWRNKALARSAKHGTYLHCYMNWLLDRFMEQKIEHGLA